ncbi:MAG: YciI family protein [Marinicella sp.]|nr:hypothetical protein [Xanthomonadales bacterium]
MKYFLFLIIAISAATAIGVKSKENKVAEDESLKVSENYNAKLAQELGADDYGMKMYVMALLKQGPNRDHSPEEAAKLQKAHMDNIKRMAESGELVLAGPFAKNDQGIQGIYIFDVKTVEEAEALTSSDPAIKAGRLKMELIPWYGSAALLKVTEIGKTIAKKSF